MAKLKWFYGDIDYIKGYGRFCRCCIVTTSKANVAKIADVSLHRVNNYWSVGVPFAGSGNSQDEWPNKIQKDTLYIKSGTKGNGLTPNSYGPPWKWKPVKKI